MRIIEAKSFNDLKKHPEYKRLMACIRFGAVFIYPTDTIYGSGCNARKDESVRKIRMITMR
ncbi:Sua5/YciO/YrdC/YwlC family protein, partial [Candidatus Woesearchaeota archaeon]|nr:Sua5/YciO/YrdC/YwlC family protein [Candidatus Woesearchaeota archaeon]